MKRIMLSVIIALTLILPSIGFINYNSGEQNVYSAKAEIINEAAETDTVALSSVNMKKWIKAFLGEKNERANRTTFSTFEVDAAKWLLETIGILGFETEVENFEYVTATMNNKEKITLKSQNVIGTLKAENNPNGYQVIIGANYDNDYGKIDTKGEVKESTGSNGVLKNATGVATALSLAEYFSVNPPNVDIVIIFFGAGEYSQLGSYEYVHKYMNNVSVDKTLLMANISKIGLDKTYMYSDEVSTKHFDFLFNNAKKIGKFSKIPRNIPIMSISRNKTIPYAHWGLVGDNAVFLDKDINVISFLGGNFSTLNLGNSESSKHGNISNTNLDTLEKLESYYPTYADKMAEVAKTLVGSIQDENFVSVMLDSRENTYNYKWATNALVANIIMISLLIVLAIVLIIVVKRLEKKFPFKPVIKKLKIAVFGKDYEDLSGNDIFIDLKPKDNPFKNPFDGY